MLRSVVSCAAIALSLLAPVSALAQEGPEERDREARERADRVKAHELALPDAKLTVSPGALLAGTPDQRLRFEVDLGKPANGSALRVQLPALWQRTAVSGLPFTHPAKLAHAPSGVALERSGALVDVRFSGGATAAAFEIVDVGIPGGVYDLPVQWRVPGRGFQDAGEVEVQVATPERESDVPENPWLRITPPTGIEKDVVDATGSDPASAEQSETAIVAVPGDGDRVAVAVNGDETAGGNLAMAVRISNDAGQTWTRQDMPSVLTVKSGAAAVDEASTICCDPMLAADVLGNVWFGGIAFDTDGNGGKPGRVIVNRIAPGSTTLQPKTVGLVSRNACQQDKPMMTLDNSPASPTWGRLYVIWNEPSNCGNGIRIVMSTCDTRVSGRPAAARCDSPLNWTDPFPITGNTAGSFINASIAAGPDGRVYAVWWDFSANNSIAGRSCISNCLAIAGWGSTTTIAALDKTNNQPIPFACPIPAQPGGRAAPTPWVDVDRTSTGNNANRVYVAWNDLKPNSGTTRCTQNSVAATEMTWDPYVASAQGQFPTGTKTNLYTDGEGSPADGNSDDWFPAITVDQSTGQAWADFYSTRDDATHLRRTTNFYIRSVDVLTGDSLTVGDLRKVSSAPSDYSTATCCQFGNDYGDYTEVAAAENTVYPVWSDHRAVGLGFDGDAYTFVPQSPGLQLIDVGATVTDGPGDGDGVIESGETVEIVEQLHNSSGVAATGIQGTLKVSMPGATVTQPTSIWPDIAAGTTAPSTDKFRVTLPSGLACGDVVDFGLDLSTAQGPEHVPVLVTVTCGPGIVSVTTGAATASTTTATLNGSVNPAGSQLSFRFDYGPTTSYGSSTPVTAVPGTTGTQGVGTQVSGLTPGTTYHYRLVALSPEVLGSDAQFTTLTSNPGGGGGGVTPTPTPSPDTTPVPTASNAPVPTATTAPTATATQTPTRDVTPPRLVEPLFTSTPKLRIARVRGVKVEVELSEPAVVSGRLSIARKDARRLGIKGTLAAKATRAGADFVTLTFRFAKKAATRLTRLKRLRMTVALVATDAAGNVGRASARATLRR